MKKILTALVGVVLLSGLGSVSASQLAGDDPINGLYQIGAGQQFTDISTWKMKPGFNTPVSSDVALGISGRGVVYNTYGIQNQQDVFTSVVAASTDAIRTGGITLSTITLNVGNVLFSSVTAGGTTYITVDISSQPTSCPRNLMVFVASSAFSATVGVFSTTTMRGQVRVFGIDGNGNPATETILFSTAFPVISTGTNIAGDLGQLTSFTTNYGQGRIAWSSISSMTIQITSMTLNYSLQVATFAVVIGYGNRLGLSNDLRYWGDVYKIVESGQTFETQRTIGLIDSDFNTYVPVLLPNGARTYTVWYRVKNSPRK